MTHRSKLVVPSSPLTIAAAAKVMAWLHDRPQFGPNSPEREAMRTIIAAMHEEAKKGTA